MNEFQVTHIETTENGRSDENIGSKLKSWNILECQVIYKKLAMISE